MKVYVDLDGVILNTEDHIFKDFDEQLKKGLVKNGADYASKIDWEKVLKISKGINNSIYYINNSIIDTSILTKVHSLNEGAQKIIDLRKRGLTKEIIIAPYQVKKADTVDPNGNLLIDDNLNNLDEWTLKQGIGIFFDPKGNNRDNYGYINEKYYVINELGILMNKDILEEEMSKAKRLVLKK